MSYTYGLVNQRTMPEMEVLRNFNPTTPEGYTYAARAAVSIKSGQAMVLDSNNMWILADANISDHLTKEIFFALKDSDASSLGQAAFDGLAAALGKDGSNAVAGQGEVVGYSCMGQYVLKHGWIRTTGVSVTYNPGDFLTICNSTSGTGFVAGSLTKTTLGSGLPIVGRVRDQIEVINKTVANQPYLENRVNSNIGNNVSVITFSTWYSPNAVDAT